MAAAVGQGVMPVRGYVDARQCLKARSFGSETMPKSMPSGEGDTVRRQDRTST